MQIVYVTDSSNKIFLSREACVALGMIPESFPTVGKVHHASAMQPTAYSYREHRANGHDNGMTAPCGCPKRDPPPTPPTKLPFPATEANREKIQTYLVDYYKSSTFNTCEHQPLPMMDGPPLRLMVD